MAVLGTMGRALVDAGLAKEPKPRKHHDKKFTCRKCGQEMVRNDGTNTMSCTHCSNYYIFK